MSEKWISNNLTKFYTQGESRARQLLKDPARFEIDPSLAREFADAMQAFRAKLGNGRRGMISDVQKAERNQARAHAVKLLRRIGNLVRTNTRLDDATKLMLGIEPRAKRSGPIPCPQEAPFLRLVRTISEGGCAQVRHELRASAHGSMKHKPEGADRLELFFDCIGLNDPVPGHPFERGRWPKMVGSVFSNRFVVTPHVSEVPLIVVYWGRWAGRGDFDFGPFSRTVVGGMVGGMRRFMLPDFGQSLNVREKPRMSIENHGEDQGEDQADNREVTIQIAVVEMHRQMMSPQMMSPQMLPQVDPEDHKQLEGPGDGARQEAA